MALSISVGALPCIVPTADGPDVNAQNGIRVTALDQTAGAEITNQITVEVVPIIAASEKPNRVRRPGRSKKENKSTVGTDQPEFELQNLSRRSKGRS